MTVRPPNPASVAVSRTPVPLTPWNTVTPFFPHNPREPVQVATSYQTQIVESTYGQSEQRAGTALRPSRSVTSLHTALNYGEGSQLMEFLRNASPTVTQPAGGSPLLGRNLAWTGALWCDEVAIEQVVDLGGGTYQLFAPFRSLYRFYVGARLWAFLEDSITEIFAPVQGYGAPGIINDVQAGAITVRFPGTFVPTTRMCVVPAIDCHPIAETDIQDVGNGGFEARLEATEVFGANSLPGTTIGVGAFPFTRYDGISTFDPPHNWQTPLRTESIRNQIGGGQFTGISFVQGQEAKYASDFSVSCPREDFWPLLRLFDASRGQLRTMWIVTDFPISYGKDFVAHGGGTVFTLPNRRESRPFRAAAFRGTDGVAVPRRVVASTGTSLTLDTALPAGDYLVSIAYLGRFASDTMIESWVSNSVVTSDFSTIEVLEEKDVTI